MIQLFSILPNLLPTSLAVLQNLQFFIIFPLHVNKYSLKMISIIFSQTADLRLFFFAMLFY